MNSHAIGVKPGTGSGGCKDRFAAKLKELKEYLRKNLNTKDTRAIIESVIRVVRGWVNYHGISDNKRRVGQFLERTKRMLEQSKNVNKFDL